MIQYKVIYGSRSEHAAWLRTWRRKLKLTRDECWVEGGSGREDVWPTEGLRHHEFRGGNLRVDLVEEMV